MEFKACIFLRLGTGDSCKFRKTRIKYNKEIMQLEVAGFNVTEFSSCSIRLKYDSAASVFSFRCYFDPKSAAHKIIFRPGAYHRCQIRHRGVLLLTGTVLSPAFSDSPVKDWTEISGYSTPGVLDDSCVLNSEEDIVVDEENQTASIPDAPLEFSGQTLETIARTVTKKYGIVVRIDEELYDDPTFTQPFTKASIRPEQTVTAYLDDLCRKKNVVMSHNVYGELVLTRAKADKKLTTTVTKVKEGPETYAGLFIREDNPGVEEEKSVDRKILHDFTKGGALDMSLAFNGQMMHRVVQVVKQQSGAENSPAQADGSCVNPYVPNNSNGLRFKRVVQQQGDGTEVQPTARMIVGDELKNIVLTVKVQGLTLGGNVITPNQMITVENHDLHLYKKTKWFIQEVELKVDKSEETATLTCVLPECFNKDKIVNVFR